MRAIEWLRISGHQVKRECQTSLPRLYQPIDMGILMASLMAFLNWQETDWFILVGGTVRHFPNRVHGKSTSMIWPGA